jgi:hypothetical protein
MPMTEEGKAATSKRMKDYWAAKKAATPPPNGGTEPSAPPPSVRPPRQIAKVTDFPVSNKPVAIEEIKHIDWEQIDLDKANFLIGKFLDSYKAAATIIQRRMYDKAHQKMFCFICGKPLDKWLARFDDYKNPDSGLLETAFICSQSCYAQYGIKREQMRVEKKERLAGRK